MLDEDVILKSTRYFNERALILNTIAIALLPTIFYGGDGAIALSLIFSIGIIAPINVITYPTNWIDAPDYSRTKYLVCVLPILITFVLALVRFFTPSMAYENIEGIEALRFVDENFAKVVSSASTSFFEAISNNIIVLSACLVAFSIFIISKSRFVLKTMLMCVAVGVIFFALFGLICDALFYMDVPLLKRFYSNEKFFSFANKNDFAFYAYIWASALMATGIYTYQRFSFINLFNSLRFPILIAGLFLFGISIYNASTLFEPIIYATIAIIFVVYTFDVFPTKSNLKRHNKRILNNSRSALLIASTPAIIYVLIAISSTFLCVNTVKPALQTFDTPEYTQMQKLDADATNAAYQKPILGWGGGSFHNVMSLNQGDDIENIPNFKASNDITKALLEYGYLGLALIVTMPLALLIYIISKFGVSKSGVIMLTPILALCALSFVATPFANPAVIISFWILIGSLIAWQNAEII